MPLFPNPLEAAALRLSVVPPMLVDYFSVLGFHSLVAGVRLGVFDALRAGPRTAAHLAADLALDPPATAGLLRVLHGLGYVRPRRDAYRLTRAARTWLCSDSPACLTEGLAFWERCACVLWTDLEKTVRDGTPPVPFYTLTENDPELSHSFQAWTAAVARRQAPAAAGVIPVHPHARHVLDLGGSHALYSVALLRRHPELHATIVDLPQALRSAAIEEDLRSRVTLRPASFLEGELGVGYDIVLLFNIIHGLSDEETAGLLKRAAAALNPGGIVVIGDQFRGATPGRAGRTLIDLLDLNYLIAVGGRIRAFPEVARLLEGAGFTRPRRRRPLRSPATDLAVAVR